MKKISVIVPCYNEENSVHDVYHRVTAVFNATNFGFHHNVFASFGYADGDAAFLMFGDLQDPPENLPEFVAKWESGYKVVVGVRSSSDDNAFMRFARRSYYHIINILAQKKQLENMDGYGLYDREFLDAIQGTH